MSREIKFRAKCARTGEWKYGFLSNHSTLTINSVRLKIDQETIGQYTGLNDKNGKEIYEGDIIKKMIDENEWIFEVKFGQGAFVFRGMSSPMSGNFMNTKSKEFEVVGNIYQK